MTTDYDQVSRGYDERYERYEYGGIAETLLAHVGTGPKRVLEVGCGTGHWLAFLQEQAGCSVVGVDPSAGMLEKARAKVSERQLAKARAESLPFPDASFDRVVMVNAVHHFADARKAFLEARRVLNDEGCVLSIALDPSDGVDDWYVYDFFGGTRARDCERFPKTSKLRAWMTAAGFRDCQSAVAERIDQQMEARKALSTGVIAKHVTSQLSELSDQAYERGIAAVLDAAREHEARGQVLTLRARLRLFVTFGQAASTGSEGQ